MSRSDAAVSPRSRWTAHMLAAVAVGLLAVGCGSDAPISSDAAAPSEAASSRTPSRSPSQDETAMDPAPLGSAPPAATLTAPPQPPPAEDGEALLCPGRPPAPPVTAADLQGWWRWEHAFLIEPSGKEYTTGLAGGLQLEPDGTWTGYRETDTGSLTNTASGPGTWTFDGKAFHLAYDDGSDTETYGAVRIGTHVAEHDGKTYRDLSLEIGYDNGDCAVYLLEGVEVPQ